MNNIAIRDKSLIVNSVKDLFIDESAHEQSTSITFTNCVINLNTIVIQLPVRLTKLVFNRCTLITNNDLEIYSNNTIEFIGTNIDSTSNLSIKANYIVIDDTVLPEGSQGFRLSCFDLVLKNLTSLQLYWLNNCHSVYIASCHKSVLTELAKNSGVLDSLTIKECDLHVQNSDPIHNFINVARSVDFMKCDLHIQTDLYYNRKDTKHLTFIECKISSLDFLTTYRLDNLYILDSTICKSSVPPVYAKQICLSNLDVLNDSLLFAENEYYARPHHQHIMIYNIKGEIYFTEDYLPMRSSIDFGGVEQPFVSIRTTNNQKSLIVNVQPDSKIDLHTSIHTDTEYFTTNYEDSASTTILEDKVLYNHKIYTINRKYSDNTYRVSPLPEYQLYKYMVLHKRGSGEYDMCTTHPDPDETINR